ncbi:zinc finger protein 2-like isoform X1 [Rana temporaria]|uniref:zinc finger protein 2-like isoform X1 n=1 Tax=Rana temporaria TaxID=8407 RepID=UPI001AAD3AD3|nr:zinc finger protein 2-like isoform X1 [Rana temporaria]
MDGEEKRIWKAVPTFEEVAVYFSRDEWMTLSSSQQDLYKGVMKDNYQSILSTGSSIQKPEILSRLEDGGEPWLAGDREERTHVAGLGGSIKREDGDGCDDLGLGKILYYEDPGDNIPPSGIKVEEETLESPYHSIASDGTPEDKPHICCHCGKIFSCYQTVERHQKRFAI